MSWAEVMKINDNVKKPLNQQIREARFLPLRIITATGTYTPEKTGVYKVICVGAGGSSSNSSANYRTGGGGGGGVAIKTLKLLSTTSYNVTVGTTASFAYDATAITATGGANGSTTNYTGGTGGTGSGGDYNYTGEKASYSTTSGTIVQGGSLGVFISELSVVKSTTVYYKEEVRNVQYGTSLLGYGGGASAVDGTSEYVVTMSGLPAAVIIIPLEMEE